MGVSYIICMRLIACLLLAAAMPLSAGEWYGGMFTNAPSDTVPEPSAVRADPAAEENDAGLEEPEDMVVYTAQELRERIGGGTKAGGDGLGRAILQAGAAYLGTPYGTGRGRMDCSLFVKTSLMDVGAADQGFPRTAAEQFRAAEQGRERLRMLKPGEKPRPGDLIFFRHTAGGKHYKGITHVGLFTGPDYGKAGTDIIHASSRRGVIAAQVTGMKIAGFARISSD